MSHVPHPVEVLVGALRWAGVLVGAALALGQLTEVLATAPGVTPRSLLPSAGLGVGAIHAPVVFGVVTLLAVVLGELVVRPRYDEGPRTADLRPRRIRDFLPPALTPLLLAVGVCAAALCTFTVLTASPDDVDRAGRSLQAVCSATTSSSRGPYPGSFYVLPYVWGLGAALVVAGAAAWRVAAFAGTTLLEHSCPRPGWVPVGWLALAVSVLALVTLVVSLVALLAPVTTCARAPGGARDGEREPAGA